MLRDHRFRLGRLLLALVLTGPAMAQQDEAPEEADGASERTYALSARLPEGRWLLAETHEAQSSTSVDGVPVPGQKLDLTMLLALDVAGGQEGTTRIGLAVRELAVSLEVARARMRYDSTSPRDQHALLKQLLEPLSKATGTVVLDAEGELTKAQLDGDPWGQVRENQPQLAPMLGDLKKLSAAEAVGGGIESFSALMPEAPRAVGDEWTKTLERTLPAVGQMEVRYQCKLGSVKETPAGLVAEIDFTAAVTALPEGSAVAMGEAEVVVDSFSSKQSGTVTVYVDTSLPISYEVSQQAKSLMRVTDRFGKSRQVSVMRKSRTTLELRPTEE